ncbi:MFS transporter [Undibacterium crateris]|uniref:MFS transporter n=1 Tax=Undibacterium crateris TaxID=2528175 RepID=UPI00138A318B|nr:MFS transporter [Undibacterium crateris]NDI84315.1 sodium:galactoside symporter [Undibacterium crateris]
MSQLSNCDGVLLSRWQILAYALFAYPLAMLALPVYVYLPQFYSEQFGLSLSLIGSILLVSRMLDAFFDTLAGSYIDRYSPQTGFRRFLLLAVPALLTGFHALFHPPAWSGTALLSWLCGSLMLVYAGFSLASIAYQSWGATLSADPAWRTRLTASREFVGLLGVISAALFVQFAPVQHLSWLLLISSVIALSSLLRWTPDRHQPSTPAAARDNALSLRQLFAGRDFRKLFLVFVLNGIAAAIPATLFLFFVKDKLRLEQSAGLLLLAYFLSAAISMPVWSWLAARIHESRAWAIGMLLAISSFVWATLLSAGDLTAFAVICVLSGFALGADLALPPALLAGVIQAAGHHDKYEGSYFGVWNWANKMNLALAAGLVLPALEWSGYTPNAVSGSVQALSALTITYAVVPSILKAAALLVLMRAKLDKV